MAVETPVNLTRKQKDLLEQFAAEARKSGKTSPESDSFFARVRDTAQDPARKSG
jgi:molecular chaperone DnaJ